ncbi:TPA: hypothetical protein OMQ99_000226 [Acinetobacter baumannii]|nr:hypothetical protein [Acinetobacter baumannii]
MPFEWINQNYGVKAEIGLCVNVDGKPGIIAKDCGNYLGVNFDEDKPGVIRNCHPTWKVEYLGMGKIRQMTAGQKRYQEFLNADWFDGNFAQWLGVDKESRDRLEFAKRYGY